MSSVAGGAGTSSAATVWSTGIVVCDGAGTSGIAGAGRRAISPADGARPAKGWTTLLVGAVRQPMATKKHPAQRISLWTGGITPSFTKHRQAAVRRASEVGTIGSDGSALQLLRLAADARCSPLLPNVSPLESLAKAVAAAKNVTPMRVSTASFLG